MALTHPAYKAAKIFDCLRRHKNYSSKLDNFVLVSGESVGEEVKFYSASYQHRDACMSPAEGSKEYYLTGNYEWFLDILCVGQYGWLDVLCIAPAGQDLQYDFNYMGELYCQSIVIAEYLEHPVKWALACNRGWIYQESAFTNLSSINFNAQNWSSIYGLICAVHLCQRRGLDQYIPTITYFAINAIINRDLLFKSVLSRHGDENELEFNVLLFSCINEYLEALKEQDEVPIRVLRSVALNLSNLVKELHAYQVAFPDEVSELLQITEKDYGSTLKHVIGSCMNKYCCNLEPIHSLPLLHAYLSNDLFNENDRQVAILGLAKKLLGVGTTEAMFRWLWNKLPEGSLISCNNVKARNDFNTFGLGTIYFEQDPENSTHFKASGIAFKNQLGNEEDEGHFIRVDVYKFGNPVTISLSIILTSRKFKYVSALSILTDHMQWLHEPSEKRTIHIHDLYYEIINNCCTATLVKRIRRENGD